MATAGFFLGKKGRIRRVHFWLSLPLLLMFAATLAWAARHHLNNEANRLAYLARGVQEIALAGAERITVEEAARISCEAGSTGAAAKCNPPQENFGKVLCNFAHPCDFRFREEQQRLQAALGEILLDLKHLPYFSQFHQERRFGRGSGGGEFSFDVAVYRRLPSGKFVQIGARTVPESTAGFAFGSSPTALYSQPGLPERATTAWISGAVAEWVTAAKYRVFQPLELEGKTAALLTLEVEREQNGPFYMAGLVVMLAFYFISMGVIYVASALFFGATWLINAFPLGLIAVLAGVVLAVYFRRDIHGFFRERLFPGDPPEGTP